MIWIGLLVCASVLVGVKGNNSSNYTIEKSLNSSHLSNIVQLPEDGVLNIEQKSKNVSQIKKLSRLYDHYNWWNHLKGINMPKCENDIKIYLKGLLNSTSWAAKMYDASGRYQSQFFFGNDYWLGSKALCEELVNSETNNEIPPFQVQFYVAKVAINLNDKLTPVSRQLHIGECLPKSCETAGVRALLSQEKKFGTSLNIIGVRKVPGDYSPFADFKLYILGGTSLIVLVLIVAATLVDVFVQKKTDIQIKDIEQCSNNINNNNNIKGSIHGSREKVLDVNKNGRICSNNEYWLKLLICFSVAKNGATILSVQNPSLESIKCIHGLKFLSITWIILVHTYLEIFAVGDNKYLRTITERNFLYQTISNATFSVDTFFFISGLLVTLMYFRTESKKEVCAKKENSLAVMKSSSLKFLVMFLYRFLRLTPAYMFVLGVNEIIMRYIKANSVFSTGLTDYFTCEKYWWRNALYINNFFPQGEFCMLWTWYMANDTQFYILACVLLLIATRSPKHLKIVAGIMGVIMVASWITSFIIAIEWDYFARLEAPFALFDQLYDKPWLRIGPYLVGMFVGYLFYKMDCKINMSFAVVISGWTVALLCLGFLVYGLGHKGLRVPSSAFYASLGHTAWALSLAWITIVCSSGYGGPLNSFLSNPLFLPLSRLTYCAYLVHPVIMVFTSTSLDGPLHLHNIMAVVIFCGNLVLSFACAFVISIAFESPVVNLLKIILHGKSV